MKTKIVSIVILLTCNFYMLHGQSNEIRIFDIDSNSYVTEKVRRMSWTNQNLNVSHFSNGDTIFQARNKEEAEEFSRKKIPCWAYYNFDFRTENNYGKMYNWYAYSDVRGLAPKGWHVATDKEWSKLIKKIRKKARIERPKKWELEDGYIFNKNNTRNDSFFRYIPQEYMDYWYWWSSIKSGMFDPIDGEQSWVRIIDFKRGYISRMHLAINGLFSVLCVED